MADDRVLDKIKKCLALSASPEPHEAAAALRQAQKLMELHGVSRADLGRSDVGSAEVSSRASISRVKDWELRLVNLVARAFGCKLLWIKSRSDAFDVYGRYQLVGLKAQVGVAQYTCEVLQRRLVKARAAFVADLWGADRAFKTKQADGFCHGWVEAVSKTVHDFALPDGTAELIARVVDERSSGSAKVQQRQAGMVGFLAGREAGARESLQRPVSSASPILQLT